MFRLRVTRVIFSSMRRNISTLTAPKGNCWVKFTPLTENFPKSNYRSISTSLCLTSSEVPVEKPTNKELNGDVNELKTDHTDHELNSSRGGQEVKIDITGDEISGDQADELDSKIGKYAELAMDSEEKKKILMILMEHEVAKLEGKKVPSKIPVDSMKELLHMYSYSSRLKYMGFLFEKELRRDSDKRKKEFKRKERESWLIEKQTLKPPEHIQYGIGNNTMVLRVRRKSVYRYYNQRLANAVLYSQKLIIDMDYDCFMRKRDCNNCGEQLLELYSVNRRSRNPFDLMFCNVDFTSTTMSAFRRYMPNLYAPDNFISMTEYSYLDLFPKEKLVYITPYAKEPLKTYDHDAVYILGKSE